MIALGLLASIIVPLVDLGEGPQSHTAYIEPMWIVFGFLLPIVLSPARSFDHGRYSSILPYEVGDERVAVGVRPVRRGGPPATRLVELPAAVAHRHLRFAADIAEASGPWREVATLEVGEPLPADEAESLRFDPVRTGGGIRPVGVLQSVRRLAYRGSRATRPTPAD